MNTLSTHLLIELNDCSSELLDDLNGIRTALIETTKIMGVTIVGETFHRFSPYGVTGVLAIAESHICVHTWPEHNYAAVDIFTCGNSGSAQEGAQYLISQFESQDPKIKVIERGLTPNSSTVIH